MPCQSFIVQPWPKQCRADPRIKAEEFKTTRTRDDHDGKKTRMIWRPAQPSVPSSHDESRQLFEALLKDK